MTKMEPSPINNFLRTIGAVLNYYNPAETSTDSARDSLQRASNSALIDCIAQKSKINKVRHLIDQTEGKNALLNSYNQEIYKKIPQQNHLDKLCTSIDQLKLKHHLKKQEYNEALAKISRHRSFKQSLRIVKHQKLPTLPSQFPEKQMRIKRVFQKRREHAQNEIQYLQKQTSNINRSISALKEQLQSFDQTINDLNQTASRETQERSLIMQQNIRKLQSKINPEKHRKSVVLTSASTEFSQNSRLFSSKSLKANIIQNQLQ